jgi:hypothetical protein
MGQNVSGKIDQRAAGFQRVFAAGAASSTDLTEQVPQAKCATSGLFCVATATTVQLTWKDCAGTACDSGSRTVVVGDVWDLPIAATELTANTGLMVVAYWHPTGAGSR